jgi:hypothetical protein
VEQRGDDGGGAPAGRWARPRALWEGLVGGLTSGQRWTASLATGLAVVVLAFGLPSGTRFVVEGPGSTATRAAAGQEPMASAPRVGSPAAPAPSGARGPLQAPPSGEAVPDPPTTATVGAALPPRSLQVVALVEPDPLPTDEDTQLPGGLDVALVRSDRAIAERFFDLSGLVAHIVEIGDPAATCEAARSGGDVIFASSSLSAELRNCLASGDVVTVAYDALGPLVPEGSSAGVLTLRRGVTANLIASMQRLPEGTLGGRVGIVADADLREAVEAALPELEGRGVQVARTTYLQPGRPVADEVFQHVMARVDVVVFATSVANQAVWAGQHGTVRPSIRFVVADAADSIVNEQYPAQMDGALALTPLALPWAAREGDVEREAWSEDCADRWESAQLPASTIGSDERLRMLVWCQQVDLALAVRDAWDGDRTIAEVIGALEVPGRLTSVLRAGAEGFGPAEDAVLAWKVDCQCWAPQVPFRSTGA